MIVTLTDHELRLAAMSGVERRLSARNLDRKGAHGFNRDDFWQIDIEGLCAEWAVAKALGVYYGPVVGHLDTEEGDVLSNVQVRSTKYESGHLLIHKKDPDDHRYVLVCGGDGHYRICGWLYAKDGKKDKYWKTHRGRSAYWIPQSDLRKFVPRTVKQGSS